MADGASQQFHLAPDIFLSLFSTTYSPQQYPGMWHACYPPSKIFSLVISVLHKQTFEVGMSPMTRQTINLMTGCPYAPKCICITCLETRRNPLSRSFKCLDIGYVADTTPYGFPVSGWIQLLWCGMLSPRLASWKASETLGIHLGFTAGNLTSASPACSTTMVSRTPRHGVKRQSLWVL